MTEEEKKAIETLKSWKDYNIRNKNKLLEADKIIKVQETILNLINKLQKENEELTISNKEIDKECSRLEAKEKSRNIEPVLINNKMYFIDKNLYEDLLNDIKSNYIPTQKIKDKIEELNKVHNAEELEDILWRENYTITELVQYVLQELLEEGDNK